MQAAKTHNPGEKAVAVISLLLMVCTLILGYMTYRQFGWRVYSKLATDLRIKNAEERRRVYILANMFTTLLRLDIQVDVAATCGCLGNVRLCQIAVQMAELQLASVRCCCRPCCCIQDVDSTAFQMYASKQDRSCGICSCLQQGFSQEICSSGAAQHLHLAARTG